MDQVKAAPMIELDTIIKISKHSLALSLFLAIFVLLSHVYDVYIAIETIIAVSAIYTLNNYAKVNPHLEFYIGYMK